MAQGTIYESSGSFYVRYSVGMTVSKNGKPRPVQKSHRLFEKNDKYYSSKAREVKLLRDAFMLTVNTRQAHAVGEDMAIAAFWENRYLPYCKEILQLTGRPRKKLSTTRGYEQIWRVATRSSLMFKSPPPSTGTT